MEVGLHAGLGEVGVERVADVVLLVLDHPHQRLELRRPPLRRPRPPRPEASPQLLRHPLHLLRHDGNKNSLARAGDKAKTNEQRRRSVVGVGEKNDVPAHPKVTIIYMRPAPD